MIKYSGIIGKSVKSGSTPEEISGFNQEKQLLSQNVHRALLSHFTEKGEIPESTTITIKSNNGSVDIVIS